MWGKLILQNALIVKIISLFGCLRWCVSRGKLLPFIILLSLLQIYLQITKCTVFNIFHQTLFFSNSYWLKYEYVKFIIFGVTMPDVFETQFPQLTATLQIPLLLVRSVAVQLTWEIPSQGFTNGSRLSGLKYVPSQCLLIKIPSWISSKFEPWKPVEFLGASC